MPPTPQQPDDPRLNDALARFLDSEPEPEDSAVIADALANRPDLTDELGDLLTIDELLRQRAIGNDAFVDAIGICLADQGDTERFVGTVREKITPRSDVIAHVDASERVMSTGRSVRLPWIIALLLLAGMLIHQAINGGRDEVPPEVPPEVAVEDVAEPADVNDSGVAVLTRVAGLQGTAATDWRVGETIPPGSMAWETGLLQLEFYCGATVVVEGPAEIEILDESRVVCRSGRLWAHVPELARGFTVLAPSFELVDLGTEFGLNVSEDGVAEVHVFDGKVELYDVESNRNLATRRELNTGDALTVDRDGTSKPIAARDADFVTPTRLSQMTDARQQGQHRDWRAFRDSLQDDPRVVAYFPFDRHDSQDRLLVGHGTNGMTIEGAIVGCEWSEGRWPGKTSLQFKRPGDRVRITVPGEFESLTYSTWLRLDGLDRKQHSILLTDGFGKNGLHWQIRQDGALILGMRYTKNVAYNYQTDSIFNLFRLGQWVHLATVYDADQACVTHYVNGELAKREPLKQAADGLLKIGKATIGNWSVPAPRHRSSSVRNFNGCIDELIVFGEALDEQEVRRIYEVGRP